MNENYYFSEVCNAAYYGKLLGRLSELHHGVSGEIYAVDGRTLFIKGFNYDGEGPGKKSQLFPTFYD